MARRADATVLAFYQDHETALQALRQVGRAKFRRRRRFQHLQAGRIAVTDNDVPPVLGAFMGVAVALAVLIVYASLSSPSSPRPAPGCAWWWPSSWPPSAGWWATSWPA